MCSVFSVNSFAVPISVQHRPEYLDARSVIQVDLLQCVVISTVVYFLTCAIRTAINA